MIQTENITINDSPYVRTYSDSGRYIVGGNPPGEYSDAIDPAELGRTYIEGNLIPQDESATDSDYENALEQMGVKFVETD